MRCARGVQCRPDASLSALMPREGGAGGPGRERREEERQSCLQRHAWVGLDSWGRRVAHVDAQRGELGLATCMA